MSESLNPSPSWTGRILASALGGTLLAFAVGVFVTVYYPGFDGLDEAFLGGLTLVLIWPPLMLWILSAPTSKSAWKRVLIPGLFFITFDILGLLL